jgi:hypothetical protein
MRKRLCLITLLLLLAFTLFPVSSYALEPLQSGLSISSPQMLTTQTCQTQYAIVCKMSTNSMHPKWIGTASDAKPFALDIIMN